MTNDELNELTAKSKEAVRLLPDMMLDGRGVFRAAGGETIHNDELLVRVTQARDLVEQVHAALKDAKRIKRKGKTPASAEATA